ncbi:signal peptidase I [Chloroflexota bacterium]
MKSFFREVLITIVLALVIFAVARSTIQTFIVVMTSMEPNFYEGQRVVVNKALYYFDDPSRGDVVVFKAPNGSHDEFIKRIIALPGDTIEVKSGVVYINDTELDEPYITRSFSYTFAEIDIPENNYFVLGDNRDVSNDSHHGWLLPHDNLIGKAWLLTWPPSDWGVVPNYHLEEQIAAAGG